VIHRIEHGEIGYPAVLNDRLGMAAPGCLYTLGNTAIIHNRLLGLLCSISCPGSIVIKTFDVVREIRDAGITVVGSFHSPMERQCLDILLRGKQPVVLCAAKGLSGLRLGNDARCAISENRLLVVSQFDQDVRRTTAVQAVQRNDLVAGLADVILVPYAVPGGKIWATICHVRNQGQIVITFADKENSRLIESSVYALAPGVVVEHLLSLFNDALNIL